MIPEPIRHSKNILIISVSCDLLSPVICCDLIYAQPPDAHGRSRSAGPKRWPTHRECKCAVRKRRPDRTSCHADQQRVASDPRHHGAMACGPTLDATTDADIASLVRWEMANPAYQTRPRSSSAGENRLVSDHREPQSNTSHRDAPRTRPFSSLGLLSVLHPIQDQSFRVALVQHHPSPWCRLLSHRVGW